MKQAVDFLDRQIMVGNFITYPANGVTGLYKVSKLNITTYGSVSSISALEYTMDDDGVFYLCGARPVCLKYPKYAVVLPDGYAVIKNIA